MYKIIVTPNAILLEKSSPVTKFGKKLRETIKEMKETLSQTVDPVGVGLAAPQVGIQKRIFIVKPLEKDGILTFINPVITSASTAEGIPNFKNSKEIEARKPKASRKKLLEGCLSIPNIWGNVSRKKEITLKYQDEEGRKHVKKFSGFPSTIIQHELDHLDGTLFTKYVLTQGEKLYRSYKNEKNEDEFEEIEV